MAIALVQHKINHGAAGSATQTVTFDNPTGAGNLIVAWVSGGLSTTLPTGVSDGTSSFSHATSASFTNPSGPSWESDVYFLFPSNSGKTVITGTWNNTTGGKTVQVWEISGFTNPVQDAVAVQATEQTGSANTNTGPTITTTATGATLAGCLVADSVTSNPKAGNEFTSGGDIASSGDGGVSLVPSTAGAHTPVWSDATGADNFQAFAIAFKDSGPAFIAAQEKAILQAVKQASFF